jgi:RimJ/RimL family protein N-acetyltransferase
MQTGSLRAYSMKADDERLSDRLSLAPVDGQSLKGLSTFACDVRVGSDYFLNAAPRESTALFQHWSAVYGAEGAACEAWSVHLRGDSSLIGMVAFHDDYLRYFLAPVYWGQGYGRELVRMSVNHLAPLRRVRCVKAVVARGNLRSEVVLVANGFHFSGLRRESFDDMPNARVAFVYKRQIS